MKNAVMRLVLGSLGCLVSISMTGCPNQELASLHQKTLTPVPKTEAETPVGLTFTDSNNNVVRGVTLQDIKSAKVLAGVGKSYVALDMERGIFWLTIPSASIHDNDILVLPSDSGQLYTLRVTWETITVSKGTPREHQSVDYVSNATSESSYRIMSTVRDDVVKKRIHLAFSGIGLPEGQSEEFSFDAPEEKITLTLESHIVNLNSLGQKHSN